MSKNYLCKKCKYNNNGWCNELKKQGLKSVTECSSMSLKDEFIDEKVTSKSTEDCDIFGNTDKDLALRVYGKREMFYHLSCQIAGMEEKGLNSISIDELKELFVNISKTLDIDEKIFGIETTCETDMHIVNSSKALINSWKNSLNNK